MSPCIKFFNNIFRKKNGKIIAKLGADSPIKNAKHTAKVIADAWQLLSSLKDHVCIWIDEKDSWTKESFLEYLIED